MKWTVGDVTVTSVVELEAVGGSRFILPQATPEAARAIDWLAPNYADENGRLRIAVQSLIVETPGRRIIVDTGLGGGKAGRRVPAWNGRSDGFLDDLAAAGFPPESFGLVVNTHLHVDHVGFNTRLVDGRWEPAFPNARYVMGEAEFGYWRDQTEDAEHLAVFADSVRPVFDAGLVDLVASDAELGPELRLIPTPGHTFGHMSLLIGSRGEEFLLVGDVLHHPCQLAHPEWSSTADYDPDQSAATRRSLFGNLAGGATRVMGAHFTGIGAGRIARDGDGFRLVFG